MPDPGGPPFSVVVRADGEEILVRVAGELDVATAGTLAEALAAVRSAGRRRVVVDLAEVTFMDCRGMSPVVLARRRGPVRVQGATGVAALVLDVTGAADGLAPARACTSAGS